MRSFFWAFAAALTACTLLTPLDDYERGDAGAPPGAGNVADGAVGGEDARADASDPPETSIPDEDGGVFSCATRASGTTLVCTEFNQAVDTSWDAIDRRQDGGYLGLNLVEHVAAPGMEARLDLNEAQDVSAAIRLARNLKKGTPPRHVRIAFSTKVVRRALDATKKNFISIAELLCGEGKPEVSPFDGVWLQFRPVNGTPVLHVLHGQNTEPHLVPDFPFDRWTRVSLDVRLESGVTKTELRVDGAVAGSFQTAGVACGAYDDRRVVVGLSSDVSARAFYDNVLVDVE